MVDLDSFHYVHDSLNRLRIVTFSIIAIEFRDYMPFFVHVKINYYELTCGGNRVIVNEICDISQRSRPCLFSLFSYLLQI